MTVKKAFLGLILVTILVLVGTIFNPPKSLPVPFEDSLTLRPGHIPPGEGVTLYSTEGPFGIDPIEATATGIDGGIYVGTFGGGLFKSYDQGKSWRPINRGLRDKFISTLFVLKDGKIFAGTIRAGLFMSENHGESWISVNKGLEKTDVTTLAILPAGDLLAGTGKGVYRSKNQGQSWEAFNTGLDHTQIKSIAIDKDQNLYVGTQGIGVFKREAQGEKWYSIVNGFAFKGLEERVIRTLLFDQNEVLFAGTMAAGIFRSADRGATWQHVNTGLENYSIRGLATDNNGILYAGTGLGVYYSKNGGEDWQALQDGMNDLQTHSFSVSPSGTLFVGASDSLYSGKIGSDWQALHDTLIISAMTTLSYGENQITIGTAGKGTYINYQDEHWMSHNMGLVNLSIHALTRSHTYIFALSEAGVYRRQIGRHQWNALQTAPTAEGKAIAADTQSHVYLGLADGLYHSLDHGDTWQKIEALGSEAIHSIVVSDTSVYAANAHHIWAKTSEGPWEKMLSREEGTFRLMLWRPQKGLLALSDQQLWQEDLTGTWQRFKSDGPSGTKILSLASDPHNNDVLYAGTKQGLYWSDNDGSSWQQAKDEQGIVFEAQVNQVITTNSKALWIATEKKGIFLGISKPAERSAVEQWLDIFS